MKNIMKRILSIVLILLLSFNTNCIEITNANKAQAAENKVPCLENDNVTLYIGYDTYRIKLSNITKSGKVTYLSDKKEVADVNSKGEIIPKKVGNVKIISVVKQNNKSYRMVTSVNVKDPCVEFTNFTNYLCLKEEYTFKAKTYGMDEDVKWSVSDSKVAIINGDGKLTALSAGSTIIYAKAGDKTAECKVDIGSNRIGTFSKDVACYKDKSIWITISNKNKGEKLKVDSSDSKIFDYAWGKEIENKSELIVIPKKIGKGTLLISSSSEGKLSINITVTKKPAKLKKLSATEVYKKCGSATVEIHSETEDGNVTGSGFFVDEGVVVTNYHVIEGTSKLQVITKDKNSYDVQKILGFDEKLDLAVLQVATKNECLNINEESINVGEESYALGSPLGLTGTMTSGMISTASRILENVDYVQTTAPLSHGNSGGPLVNSYGDVIGVNTMYIDGGQNLNFAININELQKINTNNSMTVAEYYSWYDKQLKDVDDDKTHIIKEDEAQSHDEINGQLIQIGSGVVGTLKKSEKIDYYKFTVKENGKYIIFCKSENEDDYENTYLELYDKDHDLFAQSFGNKKVKNTQFIYEDLIPGDYYIYVDKDDKYNGRDMPYVFFLMSDSELDD